jgi:hypothetical protein
MAHFFTSNIHMHKHNWKGSSLALLISLTVLATSFRAFAQQPNTPAPAPATAPASAQSDKTAKPNDQSTDQTKSKPEDAVGKSKLEKETGTINDRIFEVMPNYGTVETSKRVPPLTTGEKFRLANAGAFDYFNFPFDAALAAIGQSKNDPPSWGQGWGAYGKRYGATFADNTIGTYMTTAIFPSALHEDPRYYVLGKGSVARRAFYTVDRLFVTRSDSGESHFNYSEIIGNATAAGISNIYHPADDRTVGRNLTTWGLLIVYDGAANALKEFWPDIRRKVLHKKNP